MTCRICGSDNTKIVGKFKPYLDYHYIVHDCRDCGCRFVPHDASIYDKLHRLDSSPYLFHEDRAKLIESSFIKNDIGSIKNFLFKFSKNKFVINAIEKHLGIKKVLELGCSKGYLTAYFILRGFNAYGVDVSRAAIKKATKRFGRHFYIYGDPAIDNNAPYDAIYHVGTIGCVDSPISVTKYLLGLLKPDGILVFNAPNVSACFERGNIWVKGAYPPDLTTLFKSEFWIKQFKDFANISIYEEYDSPLESLLTHIQKLINFKNILTSRKELFQNKSNLNEYAYIIFYNKLKRFIKETVKCGLMIIAKIAYFLKIIPQYKSEFGMHIIMKKLPLKACHGFKDKNTA